MSASGSFGVNYKKTWDGVEIPLPATLCALGSLPQGHFVFVQANGAIDQYAWGAISDDGQFTELTTTVSGANNLQVGVAQVAAADNEYLWVWIGGPQGGGVGSGIRGLVAASYAADANLYTTATAGVADDDSSGTDLIKGVVGLTTDGGSGSAVELKSTTFIHVN